MRELYENKIFRNSVTYSQGISLEFILNNCLFLNSINRVFYLLLISVTNFPALFEISNSLFYLCFTSNHLVHFYSPISTVIFLNNYFDHCNSTNLFNSFYNGISHLNYSSFNSIQSGQYFHHFNNISVYMKQINDTYIDSTNEIISINSNIYMITFSTFKSSFSNGISFFYSLYPNFCSFSYTNFLNLTINSSNNWFFYILTETKCHLNLNNCFFKQLKISNFYLGNINILDCSFDINYSIPLYNITINPFLHSQNILMNQNFDVFFNKFILIKKDTTITESHHSFDDYSQLFAQDCLFKKISSMSDGGAISVLYRGFKLICINCHFFDCNSKANSLFSKGGAINFCSEFGELNLSNICSSNCYSDFGQFLYTNCTNSKFFIDFLSVINNQKIFNIYKYYSIVLISSYSRINNYNSSVQIMNEGSGFSCNGKLDISYINVADCYSNNKVFYFLDSFSSNIKYINVININSSYYFPINSLIYIQSSLLNISNFILYKYSGTTFFVTDSSVNVFDSILQNKDSLTDINFFNCIINNNSVQTYNINAFWKCYYPTEKKTNVLFYLLAGSLISITFIYAIFYAYKKGVRAKDLESRLSIADSVLADFG